MCNRKSLRKDTTQRNGNELMTAPFKLIATASVIALVSAGSAIADGVEVGGSVTNIAIVKQATNLALGVNSKAKQSIGTIGGNVEVGGTVRNVTIIGETVNLATGIGAKAEMSAGSIRDIDAPSGIRQTIVVRSIINVSAGAGTKSCVSLGYGKRC